MSGEDLPRYVEEALDELIDEAIDAYQKGLLKKELRLCQRIEVAARGVVRRAINRYARERAAEAATTIGH